MADTGRLGREFVRAAALLAALVVAFSASALRAEPRLALIVGNGAYKDVVQLDNPANDARLMGKTLEAKGFKVTLLVDADQSNLTRGIAKFGRELRDAGDDATGLFYYAGHGVQSFGTNYLLPVDAHLTDAADLGLVAIPAESVLRQMASAHNKTNIVILDACRNNPFESIPDMNDNGLAEMKAPTGTFLAYSTGPGTVALDGADGDSPFTKSLAAQIASPGLPIEQVFKQVRVDVLKISKGQQTPWDTSSLTSQFYFTPPVVVSPAEVAEQQLWNSVKATKDPVQIMLFMKAYPNSKFIEDARMGLNDAMMAALNPQAATPKTADNEKQLIERAQTTGVAEDYQAYLTEYPNGVYAELARTELAALKTNAQAKGASPSTPPAPQPAAAAPMQTDVTFSGKLTSGGPGIEGKSIEELVQGSPTYAPIEGLPDQMWKGQSCASCHKWSREALCTQGKTYVTAAGQRALTVRHPYGGGLKQALKAWAAGGCK